MTSDVAKKLCDSCAAVFTIGLNITKCPGCRPGTLKEIGT